MKELSPISNRLRQHSVPRGAKCSTDTIRKQPNETLICNHCTSNPRLKSLLRKRVNPFQLLGLTMLGIKRHDGLGCGKLFPNSLPATADIACGQIIHL